MGVAPPQPVLRAARQTSKLTGGSGVSAEANRQVVLEAYAKLNAGNAAGYWEHLAEDVRMTSFGTHRFARTFHGKDDLMKNFVPGLRERLDGTIKLHVTNIVAEGDHVVVEAQGEGRTKDGRDYNNLYCNVLTMKDGKIAEIREYLDTEMAKAIFG
jgi:uncharacterized protein